ncbi:MAG TPA: glutamate racemase [Micromonosporaceae bacterium]|nr:glutamate racemase [Micromonosporaceae bacterium]
MSDAPIGIFDSGVGGLTVARAILDQLPHEEVRYLGDTAHLPYGSRPIAEVRRLALGCLDRLVDEGVKMLVIACNTASAACLHDARERYSVPVVEVIRPAVRRAVAATRNSQIGVIGTAATVASGAYEDGFAAAPHVTVTSVACPQFVDFVERGITSGRALLGLAHGYLEPLQRAEVDTVVLGCTHYPLLTGMLGVVMGDGVTLVSSADETAREVYRQLTERDMFRPDEASVPRHDFACTGDPAAFARLAQRFLGPEVAAADRIAAGAGLVPSDRVAAGVARPSGDSVGVGAGLAAAAHAVTTTGAIPPATNAAAPTAVGARGSE